MLGRALQAILVCYFAVPQRSNISKILGETIRAERIKAGLSQEQLAEKSNLARNYIRESWSNVDTELKRRYDLIPNLVAVVKGYAAHERAVLERVTELRNRCAANHGPVADQSRDEVQLVDSLKQLLVVVENYPQLKADQNFLKLQTELVNTEDRIQAARRFYNGNVRDYRNKCESFPSNLVANVFGFKPEGDFFSVPPSVQEVPNADFATS